MSFHMVFAGKEACKLYCMADGFDFYFPLSSKVHDGTQCSRNGPDVCINGVCQVSVMHLTIHAND